jgi:aryl-alcohol dehydrogenase-like predicted oxidoreductase
MDGNYGSISRIRKEIEDSLRRLRTNVIDLYQVHWPDFETPIAETARTLEDLRARARFGQSASAIFPNPDADVQR